MSHSSIHIPYKRTSSAVLSASAARRRRPDPFENDDTQEFLGDMSARIRRALRLDGDDPEDTEAASEMTSNIFHQDHSRSDQDFQLPSLAADHSVLGQDAANADESVLAAKAPAAHAALEQSASAANEDQDTDANVKAALDQSSSSSSESEEEESELEDEESPAAPPPPTQSRQDYTSTLQTPFRDGEPDAVKRIRAHLDPEAQDVLYAPDQQDHEAEEDLDAQDDFEKWQRIPSELKGKAREDQQEADWFDDEEESDEIDIQQVNTGEYDYGNEYASGDDDQPLEPDPLARLERDDEDSAGYDAEPDQSREESLGSDQRDSDQVDEEDGNDSSDLEIMPSNQKSKQESPGEEEERPAQELDVSADTSLEIAPERQQPSPAASQGVNDAERAASQAATEQTGLPTPPQSPSRQSQDITLPEQHEQEGPEPEAPTIESLLQLADQSVNSVSAERQDAPDFEALIHQLSADAGIPPPVAPVSTDVPSVSHTQQVASEAREAAAAAASVLPPTPPTDDAAQLPPAEPAAAEVDSQPVLNEQDILQTKGPIELDASAEDEGALQLEMKPPVTASAPALQADVQSDLNMISEEAEEETKAEQGPSVSKTEGEGDTSMKGESEPDSSVEVKEDVMQESTPAIFAHVVDNINEEAKQAHTDQGSSPAQPTSGQTKAAEDAQEHPPSGRSAMEDSSLPDPPTSREAQQETTQAAAPVEQSSQVPLAAGDDQAVVNLPGTSSPQEAVTISTIPSDAPESGDVARADDPGTAVEKNDVLQEAAPAVAASAIDEQEQQELQQVSQDRAVDGTAVLPTTGQSDAQDESKTGSAVLHATAIEDPAQANQDTSLTTPIPGLETQEVVYGAGDGQAVLSLPPASSVEPASVTNVPSEAPLDGNTVQIEFEAGEIPEEPSAAESLRGELVQEAGPAITAADTAQSDALPGADRSKHDSATEEISGQVASKDDQSVREGSVEREALQAGAVEDPHQARIAENVASRPEKDTEQQIPIAAGEYQAVLTAPATSTGRSASISTVPAEAPQATDTIEAGQPLPDSSYESRPAAGEEAEPIPGLSFIPTHVDDAAGPGVEALPEGALMKSGDDLAPRKDSQLNAVETPAGPGENAPNASDQKDGAVLHGEQAAMQADKEEAEEGEISEDAVVQSQHKSPPQTVSFDIKSPRAARAAEIAAASSSEPSSSEPSEVEEERTTRDDKRPSKRRKSARHSKATDDKPPAVQSVPSRRRSTRLQRRDASDSNIASPPATPSAPATSRKNGRSALRGTASEPAQQSPSSPTTDVQRSRSEVLEQSPASLRSPALVERLQKGHSHHHRSRPERSSRACDRVNPDAPVTRSHCPFHHISLKSNVSQFRYHFLVPECSLARRWNPTGAQEDTDEFVDHGISGSPEHAFAVSLAEAGDAVNPEAEASLTRLVGPDLLSECDLLIPMPSPDSSATHQQENAIDEHEAGSSGDMSASPDPPPDDTHPPSESAATKRRRRSSSSVVSDEDSVSADSEPRRNKGWGWFRAVQGLLGRKRRKQG